MELGNVARLNIRHGNTDIFTMGLRIFVGKVCGVENYSSRTKPYNFFFNVIEAEKRGLGSSLF